MTPRRVGQRGKARRPRKSERSEGRGGSEPGEGDKAKGRSLRCEAGGRAGSGGDFFYSPKSPKQGEKTPQRSEEALSPSRDKHGAGPAPCEEAEGFRELRRGTERSEVPRSYERRSKGAER